MKSYWVLVHQFEIALKDDEIPFGTAEQLGLAGFAKLQVGNTKTHRFSGTIG
ncbi:NADH pyrophosphatase [Actinobacillus equuli]|nr:NADH pyrophosphatase [Actinobacillus equuli]